MTNCEGYYTIDFFTVHYLNGLADENLYTAIFDKINKF